MSEIILPELQIDSVYWHNYNAFAENQLKEAMKLAYNRFPPAMKKIARFAIQDVAMRKVASINTTQYEIVDDSDVIQFFDSEYCRMKVAAENSSADAGVYDYKNKVDNTNLNYTDTRKDFKDFINKQKGHESFNPEGVEAAGKIYDRFMSDKGTGYGTLRNAQNFGNALIDLNFNRQTQNFMKQQNDSFAPLKIGWTRFIRSLYKDPNDEGWKKWVPSAWQDLSGKYENYMKGYGDAVGSAFNTALGNKEFLEGFYQSNDPYKYVTNSGVFQNALLKNQDFAKNYDPTFSKGTNDTGYKWYSPSSWLSSGASRYAKGYFRNKFNQGGEYHNAIRNRFYNDPKMQRLIRKGDFAYPEDLGVLETLGKAYNQASDMGFAPVTSFPIVSMAYSNPRPKVPEGVPIGLGMNTALNQVTLPQYREKQS